MEGYSYGGYNSSAGFVSMTHPGTAIDTIYQYQEMKESVNQKEQKDMDTEKNIYKEKD